MRIGGVKEKVMAAQRAGLTTIILPKSNQVDIEDIPEEIRKKVKLVFVEEMSEVLKTALAKPLKPRLRPVTKTKPVPAVS